MFKRWLIRSVFMLPLLLCVTGWVWSMGHDTVFGYERGGHEVYFQNWWGEFNIGYEVRSKSFPEEELGCYRYEWPETFLVFPESAYDTSFGGFGYNTRNQTDSGITTREWIVIVPYWFLILPFGTILFFVWRKTRLKIDPRRAFPVKVGVQNG
jgi:hypothetical protein